MGGNLKAFPIAMRAIRIDILEESRDENSLLNEVFVEEADLNEEV